MEAKVSASHPGPLGRLVEILQSASLRLAIRQQKVSATSPGILNRLAPRAISLLRLCRQEAEIPWFFPEQSCARQPPVILLYGNWQDLPVNLRERLAGRKKSFAPSHFRRDFLGFTKP